MKIKNSDKKPFLILYFYKLIRGGKSFPFIIVIVLLLIYSLFVFYAGAKAHQKGYATTFRSLLQSNYRIPIRYFKGLISDPVEQLSLDIKHVDLQKLYYTNYYALQYNSGFLNTLDSKNDYVSVEITNNQRQLKAKARIKGNWKDSRNNYKLSLRIKVSGENTFMGMKAFSLHDPKIKGYMSEWVFHKLLENEDIVSGRYDFIKLIINGENRGVFAIEEHFDKRLIEHNKRRDGVILKFDESNLVRSYFLSPENPSMVEDNGFSISPINTYNKLNNDELFLNQFKRASSLLDAFRNGDLPVAKVFDIQKMAKLFAITDLLGDSHNLKWKNIKFYYNPVTSLLEPIGYDQHHPIKSLYHIIGEYRNISGDNKNRSIFGENRNLNKINANEIVWDELFFYDQEFFTQYINSLNEVSQEKYLNDFFDKTEDEYFQKLNIINSEFILYDDKSMLILKENQRYIRRLLSSSKISEVYVEKTDLDTLFLRIGNVSPLPIEISGAHYYNKAFKLQGESIISSKKYSEKMSYKSYKLFGEDLDISSINYDSLQIINNILGSPEILKEKANPWPYSSFNIIKDDLIVKGHNIKNYDFLSISDSTIIFNKNSISLNQSLKIPKGYTVYINPGTVIDLKNSSTIISYSPIIALGTEHMPINIFSSDSSGQGIVILNVKTKSNFQHVIFNKLSNPSKNGWELTSSITFYESPVSIRNCSFINNIRGDDYLNIIRSEFEIEGSLFKDVFADAFDGDFCKGSISNSSFIKCGNDAIDISGSTIRVDDIIMDSIGDKGLSAGENSELFATHISIQNSEIAVCSKDKSNLIISDAFLYNNRIGFTAFQKKSEFGPGKIQGQRIEMKDVSLPYIIENLSQCTIDQLVIKSNNDKVKDILYGAKYGKSSK